MAAGKRPVPFRTRKLSPPAPMVLPPGGSGRVGYRRPNNFTHRHPPHNHLCGGCLLLVLHVCGVAHCGQHDRHQQLVCTHKHPVSCGLAHCGQPRPHPSLAGTHEFPYPSKLRIADTSDTANNGWTPTDLPSGRRGFVKADNSVLQLGETRGENRPLVNFCETPLPAPLRTPHCGQPHPHPSLAPNSALRTTAAPPTMGALQRTCCPVDGVSQKLTTPICDLGKRSPDTGRSSTSTRPPPGCRRHCGLRIADNPAHTHHWPAPTNCTNRRNPLVPEWL